MFLSIMINEETEKQKNQRFNGLDEWKSSRKEVIMNQ